MAGSRQRAKEGDKINRKINDRAGRNLQEGDEFNGHINSSSVGGRQNHNQVAGQGARSVFIQNRGRSSISIIKGQIVDKGLEILFQNAAPGALHDSGERYDSPNCHPNTRVAVQAMILQWVNDKYSKRTTMWVKGAMGAGKSAIAQTIAELLHARGQLSSSFFLARAGFSGRNDHKRLIATLAYQMSKTIPETRPFIASAIAKDHLIFMTSLQFQLECLIIDALSAIPTPSDRKPRLIIIDGLDECADRDAQAVIVKVFVSTLKRLQDKLRIPHKILIASRPETHIELAFRDDVISSFVEWLVLDDFWKPDKDIRSFLLENFADIKRIHQALGRPFPDHWPPAPDIDIIVKKSSGQFIYASVVVRFLKSPAEHPIYGLKVIVELIKDTESRPYAELDALYAYIFSKVKKLDLVLRMLCLQDSMKNTMTVHGMEVFLDMPERLGMGHVALNDPVSIITIDSDGSIKFLHASLHEYLSDKMRSGQYYIYSDTICEHVMRQCVCQMIYSHSRFSSRACFTSDRNSDLMDIFLAVFAQSTPDARTPIYQNISDLDIMFHYQSIVYPEHGWFESEYQWRLHYKRWNRFIWWILVKHRSLSSSTIKNPLAMAIQNIQDWIVGKLEAFPFSGFDNADSRDFWIFAAHAWQYPDRSSRHNGGVTRAELLNNALELLALTLSHNTSSSDAQRAVQSMMPQIEPLWGLVSDFALSNVFRYFDSTLEGYKLTEERYRNAASTILRDIIHLKNFKWLTASKRTAGYMITPLLKKAKPDRCLYALLQTMMADDASDHRQEPNRVVVSEGLQEYKNLKRKCQRSGSGEYYELANACKAYIKRTREAFPDLKVLPHKEVEENNQPGSSRKRKRSLDSKSTQQVPGEQTKVTKKRLR